MVMAGFDIGTTNIKLALFDEKAKMLWSKSVRTPLLKVDNRDVLSAEKLFDVVLEIFSSIPEKLRKDVVSIGISSLGETVFPIGKNGPLSDGLIWYSKATLKEFNEFMKRVSGDEIFEITALRPSWIFSLFKMIWFYKNFPEFAQEIVTWLDVADYVTYMLTGSVGMDKCIASRSLLLDVMSSNWSEKLLDLSGIPSEHLPSLIESGAERGFVRKDIAEKLGFGKRVVVTTAGQDHITAAFSSGAFNEKSVLNSTGTTECIVWGGDRALLNTFLRKTTSSFNGGIHVFPNKYYLLEGIPTGGFAVEWFLKSILREDFDMLKALDLKETSAVFFPFLRGRFEQERIHGAFLELSDEHDRADLTIAILESLAFEIKKMVDDLKKLGLKSDYEIVAVGGGAKNMPLLQIKANVLRSPVKVLDVHDATALGAALISGITCGIFRSWKEAFEAGYNISRVFYPQNVDYYSAKYERYITLFEEVF